MLQTPPIEQIPIREDTNGQLRVGNTRVLLDLIIYAYRAGHTPETIAEQYPTLALEDIYLALGYYLRHQSAVDQYLLDQESQADAMRREHESRFPPKLTREVLLARIAARRKANHQD